MAVIIKDKNESDIRYSLEHNLLLEQFCELHLQFHEDCTEKLAEIYSRFTAYTHDSPPQ